MAWYLPKWMLNHNTIHYNTETKICIQHFGLTMQNRWNHLIRMTGKCQSSWVTNCCHVIYPLIYKSLWWTISDGEQWANPFQALSSEKFRRARNHYPWKSWVSFTPFISGWEPHTLILASYFTKESSKSLSLDQLNESIHSQKTRPAFKFVTHCYGPVVFPTRRFVQGTVHPEST